MQTYHTHSQHCGADHSRFGGVIYASDFNTDRGRKLNTDGSPIARRIISDRKFDLQCLNRIASDQHFDRQHESRSTASKK